MSRAALVVRWRLRRARLPRIRCRCAACAAQSTFEPTGRFRVNANRRTLDVWLLLRCVTCGRVLKATVAERVSVRSIPPALLAGYQQGDPGLVARVVTDPSFRRRNRLALDDGGSWELDSEPVPPDHVRVRVEVELAGPLSVRPTQLIAAGLGVSRSQVERMLATGVIRSAARLDGQTSTGFGFTIDQRRSFSPARRSPGGGRGGDRSPPRRGGAGGWRPAG